MDQKKCRSNGFSKISEFQDRTFDLETAAYLAKPLIYYKIVH
jgi:hypothetical protein